MRPSVVLALFSANIGAREYVFEVRRLPLGTLLIAEKRSGYAAAFALPSREAVNLVALGRERLRVTVEAFGVRYVQRAIAAAIKARKEAA